MGCMKNFCNHIQSLDTERFEMIRRGKCGEDYWERIERKRLRQQRGMRKGGKSSRGVRVFYPISPLSRSTFVNHI